MMAVGDPLHSSPARAHSSRLYHEKWWWPRAGIYHTEITTATLRLDDYVTTRAPGLHTLQGLVVNRLVFHSGPADYHRLVSSGLSYPTSVVAAGKPPTPYSPLLQSTDDPPTPFFKLYTLYFNSRRLYTAYIFFCTTSHHSH